MRWEQTIMLTLCDNKANMRGLWDSPPECANIRFHERWRTTSVSLLPKSNRPSNFWSPRCGWLASHSTPDWPPRNSSQACHNCSCIAAWEHWVRESKPETCSNLCTNVGIETLHVCYKISPNRVARYVSSTGYYIDSLYSFHLLWTIPQRRCCLCRSFKSGI